MGTGGRLLIEAPTGTGKTLAYLVPAIEHARATGGTVVVAPHSKVLQDQIMATLEELAEELQPFESVLVKGRNNYIDLEALAGELDALAVNSEGVTSDTAFALSMVCEWVAQTPTGDWNDLRAGALEGGRGGAQRFAPGVARRGRSQDRRLRRLIGSTSIDGHATACDTPMWRCSTTLWSCQTATGCSTPST